MMVSVPKSNSASAKSNNANTTTTRVYGITTKVLSKRLKTMAPAPTTTMTHQQKIVVNKQQCQQKQ